MKTIEILPKEECIALRLLSPMPKNIFTNVWFLCKTNLALDRHSTRSQFLY